MRINFCILFTSFFLVLFVTSCHQEPKRLPYMGNMDIQNGDTTFHTIPEISLTDQDSQLFRISTIGNKIIIADFFFISCPSICPKVKKQMLRLYDHYKEDDRVLLVSHTIDPRHDSIPRLKTYAQNLGADSKRWKFVTGDKDSIFDLADAYFVSAVDDPTAPGGFDHSGRIILVDKNRHIRGFCEGTDPESVTAFFKTIDMLLKEYEKG